MFFKKEKEVVKGSISISSEEVSPPKKKRGRPKTVNAVNTPAVMDMTFANSFVNFLKEKGRLNPKASSKKEAEHFRLLREEDGITEQTIQEVLNYYLENFDDKWIPLCQSSSSFREKFSKIQEYMKRHGPKTISKEAKEISDKLLAKGHWPRGAGIDLPEHVQEALDNYSHWLKKFNSVKSKQIQTYQKYRDQYTLQEIWDLPKEEKLEYYQADTMINYLNMLEGHFHFKPESFVYYWFLEVYDNIKNWEDWKGSLKPFLLDPKKSRFQGMFSDFTCRHYLTDKRWQELNALMKEIK